jgi:hypothetical protein
VDWHELPQQAGVVHSHPSRSGAAWLQSTCPALHAYVHVVPVHVGVPVLMSQAFPQPPQLAGVVVWVSQPSRSGAVFVQSAQPAAQPRYWQVVPSQAPAKDVATTFGVRS